MSRVFGVTLAVVGLFVADTRLLAEEKGATSGDIVCLNCREVEHANDDGFPLPLLARELVREAFLVAARDELGLLTRDATLREVFPTIADKRWAPFDCFSYVDPVKHGLDYHYYLGRGREKNGQKLADTYWEWNYHVDIEPQRVNYKTPQSIAFLAERAESLSRGEFKDLLKRLGWGKPVAAARASSSVPHKTEEALWAWNEIAVLGGLRQVHAEIRKKGESPELLAALAVGYANLGLLTEHYYSAAAKAFSARGLLYAERLLRKTDNSAWALWHRAYVRAIVGLHHLAEADIATAREKQAKTSKTQAAPFWTDVIDSFLQGRMSKMLETAKTPRQRTLASYLNFEVAMWVLDNERRVKTAQAVLEDCPDCFRAYDGMCSMHFIGVLHTVTEGSFGLLSKSLRRRLPEIDGLPAALAKRVRDHEPQKETADEVEFRFQLVSDVKEAAKSGADDIEPSLAVLGQFIEEIEFTQVLRRLELERYVWAVHTDETIATFRPLCERHPYGAFVDLFSNSTLEVLKGVATLVPRIDPAELTYMQAGPFRLGRNYDRKRINYWLEVIYCHADPVCRDEMIGLDEGATGTPVVAKFNDPYMKMLAETTSKFPEAIAAQISRNWKETKSRVAGYEKEFADNAAVLTALMNKYKELKQYADAERCAKQRIRIAPDFPTYRSLAAIYKAKGDMVLWKDTLEKSLSLTSMGLESSQVRNMLARYHMARKEWKEAVPYADAAAESYAGWAMETAARCHEMLGEWEAADRLMRQTAERYDGDAFDWMLWCCRTGHGDLDAAIELSRKHFESLGTSPTTNQLEDIGIFYLLTKEPEKALAVFQKAYSRSRFVYDAMQLALITDGLGDAPRRDSYLAAVALTGLGKDPKTVLGMYSRLVAMMKNALPPGSMKTFDYQKLDKLLDEARKCKPRSDTNFKYFVAVFLKNRGEMEKARYYLIRAAQTEQERWRCQTLASQLLHEMKVPFVTLGDEKPATGTEGADP